MRTSLASHRCLALVLFLSAWANVRVAHAQTRTADLQVVAVVDLRCAIATLPVSFGTYAPAFAHATTPLDATGGLSVNCTQGGNNVRVWLGQGQYPAPGSTNAAPLRQMGSGANRLTYNLYTNATRTTVWRGQNPGVNPGPTYPNTLTVYGRIPAGQNVPAGLYTDVVVATVNF